MKLKQISSLAAIAFVLTVGVTTGCSSAVKEKATETLKGPACSAIDSASTKLANAETQTPEQLEQAKTTAQTASTAIKALGDKVPADLSTKVDEGQQQLTDAVSGVKSGAADSKAKVQAAAANLTTQLDQVKSKLGC